MKISNVVLVFLALTLSFQVLKADENNGKETTKPPFNPLEDLILNKPQNVINKPLTRVKRQYGPYYGRYYPDYPVPIFLPFGFGGYGVGYGRGFGGRGYAGRGVGGRGFGGRGFGGRGFGGRGGGFGGRGGRG